MFFQVFKSWFWIHINYRQWIFRQRRHNMDDKGNRISFNLQKYWWMWCWSICCLYESQRIHCVDQICYQLKLCSCNRCFYAHEISIRTMLKLLFYHSVKFVKCVTISAVLDFIFQYEVQPRLTNEVSNDSVPLCEKIN